MLYEAMHIYTHSSQYKDRCKFEPNDNNNTKAAKHHPSSPPKTATPFIPLMNFNAITSRAPTTAMSTTASSAPVAITITHASAPAQQSPPIMSASLPKVPSNALLSNVRKQHQDAIPRTGSFVVGQKLRESKWFGRAEMKILCAVLETGFVVEVRNKQAVAGEEERRRLLMQRQQEDDGDEELDEELNDRLRGGDGKKGAAVNGSAKSRKEDKSKQSLEQDDKENDNILGVAVWNDGFEKSKDPECIQICTLQRYKDNYRAVSMRLFDFWNEDAQIRINNFSDRSTTALDLEQIRSQVEYVLQSKNKWHNGRHLTYYCRYGPVHVKRTKNVSDLKWSFKKMRQKLSSFTSNNSGSD